MPRDSSIESLDTQLYYHECTYEFNAKSLASKKHK